jgi:hypothetical protein
MFKMVEMTVSEEKATIEYLKSIIEAIEKDENYDKVRLNRDVKHLHRCIKEKDFNEFI